MTPFWEPSEINVFLNCFYLLRALYKQRSKDLLRDDRKCKVDNRILSAIEEEFRLSIKNPLWLPEIHKVRINTVTKKMYNLIKEPVKLNYIQKLKIIFI